MFSKNSTRIHSKFNSNFQYSYMSYRHMVAKYYEQYQDHTILQYDQYTILSYY